MRFSARLISEQIEELKLLLKGNKDGIQTRMTQAILLLDQGQKAETIKLVTGLGRSRAFWLRREYLAKGKKVLDVKPRGINKLLTKKQLKEIIKTVRTKKPKDLGFYEGYEFWNTGVLASYIEREYHIRYKSKTSYYLIFKRVKFTYHKPGRVYQKHDPIRVKLWRKEITPKIRQFWKDPKTVLLCEDEMKLSTQTTFQKIWLPAGEYPEVKVSNKKESRSLYGFLNIKTGQQHAFKTLWQNMYITRDQLVKIREIYPAQKLVILWDGPGSHRGKEVTKYIQDDGKIELIYFPPYSPQENPQEHVWREGRKEVSHNKFIENIDTATDEFVSYLNNRKFPYKLLKFKSTFGM